jgi:hypothetical protein
MGENFSWEYFIIKSMVVFLFTTHVLDKISFYLTLKRYGNKKIIDPDRIICPHCKYVFSLNQRKNVFDLIKSTSDETIVIQKRHLVSADVNLSCLKCNNRFRLTRKNDKWVNSTFIG